MPIEGALGWIGWTNACMKNDEGEGKHKNKMD
jgi:hypothetical protein